MTRRHALLATGASLSAQRLAPVEELVNTFEMEAMARQKLPPALFAEIAGGSRAAFDRITLRPRLMVDTSGLDLSLDLFGQRIFAPILVGPTAMQGRFHEAAERAMVEGANAAKTAIVFAAQTTLPVEQLSKSTQNPFWLQIDPARQAVHQGASALIVTLTGESFDWSAFDRLRAGAKVPVLLKGVMSPSDAKLAIRRGASGIIVSNYRKTPVPGLAAPIEVLPAIAAEINNAIPIFIDGGFRRGSDILKALALGARAVLLGRPPLWGLAAYGARGVQQVLEQLQTELARDMAMCGKVTLQQLAPDLVKIHRR
ncbi:MAG: alpha-hydroxy-acid oxidizing protein [Bryobacteraceae bacterium]